MATKTLIQKLALAACVLVAAGIGHAQIAATMSESSTAPTLGANDQSQLLFAGVPQNAGNLNYYWDNGTPNGQTFTTGGNAGGYILDAVSVKTGGGGGANGSPNQTYSWPQPFRLRIYSIVTNLTSTNATLVAFYQSQTFSFTTQLDWAQMSGLNLPLKPNTQYAYTFQRTTSGYENLANTNGNPYTGGQACQIPTGGGAVAFGTATNFDATFVIGASLPTALTVAPPTSSQANPVISGATVTLTAGAVVDNVGNGTYTYQWQTDGGANNGGALTNIPGATGTTLSVNTTGRTLGGYQYTVVVTDSTSASVTSSTLLLDISQVLSGTFADIGTTDPTVGSFDAAQLVANATPVAGGLNYYSDNATPPGQTFTTGNNSKGYSLGSLAIRFSGGNSASTTTPQTNHLYIFQVTADGLNANLMADITNLQSSFTYGDWVQWSFPAITLNSNAVYAYTFRRQNLGYAGLATSPGGNVYPGGELCLIPNAGGPITFVGGIPGSALDGTFDVGLVPIGVALIVNAPSATPNPVYALTPVKLSDRATTVGTYTYKWLTDDGSGAVPPNYMTIAGATATNLTVIPKDLNPGGGDYTTNFYFVASDFSGNSATSSVITLTVHAASIPIFTANPSPTNLVTFAGSTVRYSVTETGTAPITNQWQFDNGGGFTGLTTQTNTTLVLNNVQTSQSGNYQITATNLVGTSNSLVTLTVLPAPATPASSLKYPYMIVTNNPWAYWRLNEAVDPTLAGAPTYTAYDYSGHNFNATYGNAVTTNDGPVAPTYPGFETTNLAAGTFAGLANAYLTSPALNMAGSSNVTFMAWINPNGPQVPSAGLFFNRGGSDAACGFGFGNIADHLGYTWNNNNANTYSWDSTLVVQQSQWNFVAYVITPTNATIYLGYINGSSTNFLQANNPIAHIGQSFTGGNVRIGGDPLNTGRTFTGSIDEPVLFTNALSTAQIQQYFLAGIGASALAPTVAPVAALPSATVYSGQNVRLTAGSSGTEPLTNQWQVSSDGVTWFNVAGANANTLLINPQTVGVFYYQMLSSNAVGSASSGSVSVTFNPLPSYPAALWTANFQPTNNLDAAQNIGGGLGRYVGRGVVGNGTYWNILPHILTAANGYAANTINSVSDLLDDGVTHSGIYARMNSGGSYNGPGGSLPYSSDINNLLGQWYRTYFSDAANGNGALQFFGVPAGTYNLVCYGGSGMTRNGSGNLGSTFVVIDPVNGNQTNSTLAPSPTSALAEGVNFVTFTNVHMSGTVNIDVQANPNATGSSAAVNGAQLQLVSYDVAAPPVLLNQTYNSTNRTLSVNWSQGILQTATNLMGPWTSVYVPSPIVLSATNAAQFYRIQVHP